MKEYKFLIGGEWRSSEEKIEVKNPYNEEVVGIVYLSSKKDLDSAISIAFNAFEITKRLQSYEKAEILVKIAEALKKRKEELAKTITLESGKPIKDSITEVERAITTFTVASEEAKRIGGEYLPLDIAENAKGRIGITKRFPIGSIAAITPFNFPLNLVSHKIAPSIASGNPIVLKPASKTPITALKLGEIILETKWPRGGLSVVPCPREVGNLLVTDSRFKMLTFTGSSAVGWKMKENAGARKKVVLELGGNAGLIIHKDANIKYAAKRAIIGSFNFSGQSCISVQRLYLHEDIYEEFIKEFLKKVKKIKIGDPLDMQTDLSAMIDSKAAIRTQEWIEEAVKDGAKVLIGGNAKGRIFEPTVIENVNPKSNLCSKEAFAPVVIVFKYKDIMSAINEVNNSIYGLQAGIFTKDFEVIWKAYEKIEVGCVIINDIPTWRVENMPYGGVKESGFGREGIKYAIEEMTEIKLMVINLG